MAYYTLYKTPSIGSLTLISDGTSLTGCRFDNEGFPHGANGRSLQRFDDLDVFLRACDWLDRYFAGAAPHSSELPLNPTGSTFQLKVWELLRQIPYGETVTYGSLAKQLAEASGKRMSAQAVGGAVGRNPLGVIVPCHRVVGANGNLTGFGGGLDKKIALLQLEGLDMAQFHTPA